MIDTILKFCIRILKRPSLVLAIGAITASIIILFTILMQKLEQDTVTLLSLFIGITASILGGISAFVAKESLHRMHKITNVFISYTHQDTEFVKMLAEDLKGINVKPVIDRLELKVGDNIRQIVDEMIDRSDYFLFVISENSMKSDWAKKELEQAMARKKKVLPVLLHSAKVPSELSGVFYADFTKEYETGLEQLKKTLGTE